MTDPLLFPELARPRGRRLLAMGLGCGLLGAGLAFGLVALAPTPAEQVVHVVQPPATVVAFPMAIPVVVTPRPSSPSSEVSLVFRAGGASYIKLAELASADDDSEHEATPQHGAVQLFNDDNTYASIGAVRDRDVPLAHRAWKGKKLKLDTGCEATVTGFAVVGRVTGDPGYAGIQRDTWDAASVMASGHPILAAKLDHCTGLYARDSALPEVAVLEAIEDKELVKTARAALISSAPAKATQSQWAAESHAGAWYNDAETELTTQVLRHPRTGETWVSVHGHRDAGCGEIQVNLWGLFRKDASGKLIAVQLRALDEVTSILKLIDIDGDGEPELLGRPWLGLDLVLVHASGKEIERLPLEFYGCPC